MGWKNQSVRALFIGMIVMTGSVVRAETGKANIERETQKFGAALEDLTKALSNGGSEGVSGAAGRVFSAGGNFGAVIAKDLSDKGGKGGSTGPTNPNDEKHPIQQALPATKIGATAAPAPRLQGFGLEPNIKPPLSSDVVAAGKTCVRVCVRWGWRDNGSEWCMEFEWECK